MSSELKASRWLRPEKCVWGLLCHLPHHRANRMPMMMLSAYIDDSGKEMDSPTQVLAGYLASADRWAEFSNVWQAILDKAGISSFHMVDAYRMSAEYQPLGRLGLHQLISDLLQCIKKYTEHAFVLSIDMNEFRHWFGREEFPNLRTTRPYFVGFHAILNMICDHVYHTRDNHDFMIYFDEQGGESASHTLAAVEELRKAAVTCGRDNMRIPLPQFISDEGMPPLQAADVLAWLLRREDYNYRNGDGWEHRAECIWLDEALSIEHTAIRFDREKLQFLSRNGDHHLERLLNQVED